MNKVLRTLFVLLFFVLLSLCVYATEAESVDYSVTAFFPGANTFFDVNNIDDNNINTSSVLPAGLGIELSTSVDSASGGDNIGYVYVKFSTTPVPYTITYNNTVGTVAFDTGSDDMHVINAGEHGFLHNLTVIDGDVSSIMISSEYDMDIADILIYSKGTLPQSVQRWEPTLSECDVLCFPTHPDDESLFMGALISESVARGRLVQVALICNDKTAPYRPHELLDAVWTLGVKLYPIIGSFPDHYSRSLSLAQSQYDTNAMLEFIVECIRRTKPSVVVAHDPDGEYGHGAHMLTSFLVREAIELTEDPEKHPQSATEYGVHKIKKLFLHLYKENELILDVKKQYDTLGGRSPFDLTVDAYDCHKSQHIFDDLYVTTSGNLDCSRFGLFYSSVGYDTANGDIFVGVPSVTPKVADESVSPEESKLMPAQENTSYEHLSDTISYSFTHMCLIVCILISSAIILYGIISTRRH